MFVQGNSTLSSVASGTAGVSLTGVAAGHGLVCFIVYTAVASAQTLTDSSGTKWILSKSVNLTGGTIAVFEPTSAVVAGTHTLTATWTGGGASWPMLIEDDQGIASGAVVGQSIAAPGAGNTLVPGATVGVTGSSLYQLAIDNTHTAAGFQPLVGAFTGSDSFRVFANSDTVGNWVLVSSAFALGGTNPGMAPGSSDSTGADTYGVIAAAFAPGGGAFARIDQVVLVEEPVVYFRSPDYAGLLFNRTSPPITGQPFFLLSQKGPLWQLFDNSIVSVYPVLEEYTPQAVQPVLSAYAVQFRPSRRLEGLELEPEREDYRRWNHAVYWQYVRLYAAQLVGYTFTIPDFCDDPWLEWVHPKKSDESAIYPYRQINVFIRGQQFNLFWNQPKPWPVEGEPDPVVDRKANYGVMLPWGRPAITLIMPNVVGLPVAQAIGIIEGLSNLPAPDLTYQNSLYQEPPYAPGAALVGLLPAPPPIPAGIVIAQTPLAGAPLQFPFFTALTISTGLVTLPGQGASTNYSPVNIVIGDDTPP